ncbi:MAG: ArgE/DapE family deacylase [Firmicutes bacterium]|nr:ArgE/DapE family deacylase [Bacillota bacterium]
MNRQQSIDILRDVIQIKSENGSEREVARYYERLLKEHGISSKRIDYSEGRCSLVAEISNGEGPTLAVSGHMDVVSAGDESLWTYPPFSGEIEDGMIWGRGASDMKSGLSALVIALIEVNERRQFKGTLRLLATVGEEIGQLGAKQLADQGYVDDVEAVLIGEPCDVGVAYAHKGSLNYKVVSKGILAHSSTPEIGENAVEHLLEAMSEIRESVSREASKHTNDVLGKTFHNITVVKGGHQVNSIPDYAEFEANARTIPEFDNEALMREVRAVVDRLNEKEGFDLTVEVTADLAPVETDPDSRIVRTICEVANRRETLSPAYLLNQMNDVLNGQLTGMLEGGDASFDVEKVGPMVISGTTDAAQFHEANRDLKLAVYGPGTPVLNHKVDERLPLSQYLDFIDAYRDIIERYLGD